MLRFLDLGLNDALLRACRFAGVGNPFVFSGSLGHPHFPKALQEINPLPREWRISDVPFGRQPTLGCGLSQCPLFSSLASPCTLSSHLFIVDSTEGSDSWYLVDVRCSCTQFRPDL